ncbi:MAG: hypothetical protein RMI91_07240 [Gemmatales bacterium]|nr:hypothetical protein [Gemmatales bacterium]MDW7994433.1 hypothetical protein [Gemmatales bacterium]
MLLAHNQSCWRTVAGLVVGLAPLAFSGAIAGCQRPSQPAQTKKISLEEYNQMSVEERYDPYVLQHLDTKPAGWR